MSHNNSIKLKATFLLFVFSLNMVVAFACASGVNMGYNSTHHPDNDAVLSHEHASPAHQDNKAISGPKHSEAHSHDAEIADHHQSEKSKDDCCADEAEQFARMDKMAPKSIDFNIQAAFIAAYFSSFYHFDVTATLGFIPKSRYSVLSHHPPIPEIRIAIQSFLI